MPDSVRALVASAANREERRRILRAFRERSNPDGAGSRGAAPQRAAVFVREADGTIRPVSVRTGAQTWEYTEIVGGLEEGAEVVVPPSANLAAQSEQMRARARRWSGGRMMGRR